MVMLDRSESFAAAAVAAERALTSQFGIDIAMIRSWGKAQERDRTIFIPHPPNLTFKPNYVLLV
jgi:hypothetical protein